MSRFPSIKFGTSGWRAIIAEDFTFDNVAVVVRAIADELLASGRTENGVLIVYDARFLGPRFARHAARVLAGAGLKAYLTDRPTPTPVAAFEIIRRGAAGGINFTASHNPAEYQGLKFSPHTGGPATKELTSSLEKRISDLQSQGESIELGDAPEHRLDPRPEYVKRIAEMVDLKTIGGSGLKILVNPLYGAGRGYLDEILRDAGCEVETISDSSDPSFGGFPPEPAPEYVEDFISRLNEGFDLGLATDGDADRFGIFAPNGVEPNANEILGLVLDHLVQSRGWKGRVVRSVATSHFIDRVAELHGCEIVEVPVGFKWIAEEMAKDPESFVIGGEESGGLTIRGHVPEKDGILACLLVAEMVAMRRKGVGELLEELKERTGPLASKRVNVQYDERDRARLVQTAAKQPDSIDGRKVVKTVDIDGNKYILDDGSWIMVRFSGTEPVIRLYAEDSPDRIEGLIEAGRQLLA